MCLFDAAFFGEKLGRDRTTITKEIRNYSIEQDTGYVFNTTATSVISRKKELALLEVVGMTKKQVSKMLVAEGFLYLGGAFVIAVLLVVFGAEKILANTLGTAFFFRMHLTIVPCVLMIPILVGIAYVIPKYQFEKMSRESIVERIRKE